jgi:hypothetical protein
VIVYKWRIVLGGLAAASFIGTFTASPAFASTTARDRVPVDVHPVVVRAVAVPEAVVPEAAQLIPGTLSAVTAFPALSAVASPVSGLLSTLNQVTAPPGGSPADGSPADGLPADGLPAANAPDLTGVLPAIGAATGALLSGVGQITDAVAAALLPALGPAVSGLTAPIDGLSQDVGNLAGLPVLGTLITGVPALPDAGALIGDLNGLVNGVGN